MVPCYNEASRIRAEDFLTFARGSGGRARLLFVDDGSVDDTLAILEDIRSKCPEAVSVLALPRNVGKAEAVEVGMLAGATTDRPSSASGTPTSPPRWTTSRCSATCSTTTPRWTWCSARASDSSVDAYDDPCDGVTWVAFATLASTAPHGGVYDTQCGAKLFRVDRHGELRAVLGAPFETRWVFDCEMIGRYAALRRWGRVGRGDGRTAPKLDPELGSGDASASVASSVYEYPLHRWEDVAGSKVRMSDVVKMAWGLVMIRRRYFGSTPWPPVRGG